MYLVYEVDKNKWDEEYKWLHSIMPWTKSKRNWHYRYNNIRKTFSIRAKPEDTETELLLKLSRPVKIRTVEWW